MSIGTEHHMKDVRWRRDVNNLSTESLVLCLAALGDRLTIYEQTGERALALVVAERLAYVRRELELRSVQLALFDQP